MKTAVKKKVKSIELPTEPSKIEMAIESYIIGLYGPPGVGKSSFAAGLGRGLFLSTDRGTRNLNTLRVEIYNVKQLDRTLDKLEALDPADMYEFIILDHFDDFCNFVEEDVCAELGIESLGDAAYGKGWKAYRKALQVRINRILKLGVGFIAIMHETIKEVETRSMKLDRTMPDLGKPAWKTFIPKADIVAYCGFRTVKVKGGDRKEVRTIETQPREDLYAKDRTSREQPERGWMELDSKKFLASFKGQ